MHAKSKNQKTDGFSFSIIIFVRPNNMVNNMTNTDAPLERYAHGHCHDETWQRCGGFYRWRCIIYWTFPPHTNGTGGNSKRQTTMNDIQNGRVEKSRYRTERISPQTRRDETRRFMEWFIRWFIYPCLGGLSDSPVGDCSRLVGSVAFVGFLSSFQAARGDELKRALIWFGTAWHGLKTTVS